MLYAIRGQSISVRAKDTRGHPLEVHAIFFYPMKTGPKENSTALKNAL